MMVSRFACLLINDPEVEIFQRFILTVNSGESVQFPVMKGEDCPFYADMDRINGAPEASGQETPA